MCLWANQFSTENLHKFYLLPRCSTDSLIIRVSELKLLKSIMFIKNGLSIVNSVPHQLCISAIFVTRVANQILCPRLMLYFNILLADNLSRQTSHCNSCMIHGCQTDWKRAQRSIRSSTRLLKRVRHLIL